MRVKIVGMVEIVQTVQTVQAVGNIVYLSESAGIVY
jgi:hypothetical protein